MTDATLIPVKSQQIRQHNALTTAYYNYTELQMDLMMFLISKLRSTTDDLVYHLPVLELSDLTGKSYNYNYLQSATEDMGSRMFKVKTGKGLKQVWMFQSVNYADGSGSIEMRLSQDILPYLFDLKSNFTTYEIHAALKLSSKYAKRIYPMCSQWKDKDATPIFELHELKEILGLVDGKKELYPLYANLKKRVLDISIDQINQLTDLHLELVEVKKGRAISAIGFKVRKKDSYALPIPFPSSEAPPAPAGISDHQFDNAERLLDEVRINDPKLRRQILSDPDTIKKVLKFAHDLRTSKVVATTNPGGLLLTILGLVDPKAKPRRQAKK
jgi:plasmid replication initiation protein